jgi:hypothetical protein
MVQTLPEDKIETLEVAALVGAGQAVYHVVV